MPELQMAAPGDIRGRQDEEPAYEIEQHAKVAPVEAIDQHAPEERNEKSGQGHDNHLPADSHGRMRGSQDVPAHTREVHAAAEERHEHRNEEIPEAALRPDQLPVHHMCGSRLHGAYWFTIELLSQGDER